MAHNPQEKLDDIMLELVKAETKKSYQDALQLERAAAKRLVDIAKAVRAGLVASVSELPQPQKGELADGGLKEEPKRS